MPKLGVPELAIILIIVLIIFGVGRIPQIGSAMGKSIREFKKARAGESEFAEQKFERAVTQPAQAARKPER